MRAAALGTLARGGGGRVQPDGARECRACGGAERDGGWDVLRAARARRCDWHTQRGGGPAGCEAPRSPARSRAAAARGGDRWVGAPSTRCARP